MTCTHHDITEKFNYFRHLRGKSEDGTWTEYIQCSQCFKKWLPEKAECEHDWVLVNDVPSSCNKCGEKANQGGYKPVMTGGILPVEKPSEPLKDCLKKIREASDSTTPCPTCGYTENGMTVREEEEIKRRMDEEEFLTAGEVFKDDEVEWRKAIMAILSSMQSGLVDSVEIKKQFWDIRKKFL